jgi:hypothetical protein
VLLLDRWYHSDCCHSVPHYGSLMYIDSSKIRINQPGRAARLMARTLTASSTEVLAGLVDRVTVAERLFGCRIIYSDATGLPDPSEGILHFRRP